MRSLSAARGSSFVEGEKAPKAEVGRRPPVFPCQQGGIVPGGKSRPSGRWKSGLLA